MYRLAVVNNELRVKSFETALLGNNDVYRFMFSLRYTFD